MIRLGTSFLTALLPFLGGYARAQTFTVSTVTTPNVGNVVAANSGQTIFRADASTGTVTRVAGAGVRLSTTTVRSLVTFSCGNQTACDTSNLVIAIASAGASTGRAVALQNFTASASGATALIITAPGVGNSINLVLGPVGRNSSKTLWVGFDLGIQGNDSSSASGAALSNFTITVSRVSGSAPFTAAGSVIAYVFRALAVSNTRALSFGRIVRPTGGTGTVALSPVTGLVTVTGTGARVLSSPTPASALFAITGEGGQAISISVPSSFVMTGAAGNLTVNTTSSVSGAQVLNGLSGSQGSMQLQVGGSYGISAATPAGAYAGTIAVTVQYN